MNDWMSISNNLRLGLTDARLKKHQSRGKKFELIEDAVFVAHNVKFDANLLAEASSFGKRFEPPTRIDTVELFQIFYPTWGTLHERLQLNREIELHHAHSALADATSPATVEIERKLRAWSRD